ncbi:MAG: DUF748 domain-containing protein [Burkholderiales bacterium]
MSPRGTRFLRASGWIAGAVALWLAFGFFAVPPVAKHVAERQLTARLERETTIERVAFNPLTLEAVVSGLVIKEPSGAGEFFGLDELRVNLQAWQSLWSWAPVVYEARLVHPRISLIRQDPGRYNFSDLLDRRDSGDQPSNDGDDLPRFSVNNIQILDARVVFDDRPNAQTHTVDEILLNLPFVSSLPAYVDIFIEPAFQARVNGTAIALEARSKPFKESRDTGVDIRLDELDLTSFLPYLPRELPLRVDSASLSADLSVDFQRDPSGQDLLNISGTASLHHVAAREQGGKPLLAAPRIDIGIASIRPITRIFDFEFISGESVKAQLRRGADGRLNLSQLFSRSRAAGNADAGSEMDVTIRIGEIRLSDSRVEFSDDSVRPRFTKTFESVGVSLTGIDSTARTPIATMIEATALSGERISQRGEIAVSPFTFSGEFQVAGMRARHYQPYYAPYVRFRTRDGILDIRGSYKIARDEGRLSGYVDLARIDLRNGELTPRGEDDVFMSVTRARLEGRIDFDRRQVKFRSIVAEGGDVFVHLDTDRRVNLATYFTRADRNDRKQARRNIDESRVWTVDLGKIQGQGATVRFRDDSTPAPAEFVATSVTTSADGLTTQRDKPGTVKGQFEIEGGTAAISGSLTLRPFAMELDVELRDTDVLPSLPYFSDRVNLDIKSGRASFDGKLAVGKPGRSGAGYIEGDVNITGFTSADKATEDDMLSWGSLYLSGFRAAWLPAAVSFDEIALSDFYSRLIVRPDGSFNVQDVLVRDEPARDSEPEQDPEAAEAPPPIRINRITLQGGTVDFTDRFIQPNYSATLIDIGGTVAGLSSEPGTLATVDLRGQLDTGAPTEITGQINPLAGDLVMDMRGDVRGIELSRLSPYAGKYLGYGIERGTLSFRAHYQVEEGELRAENQVTLNQLIFGERVESPDAIRVPVQLALSLLKDRNGVIEVNVPISGTLDDPEFSVGGIVMRIILNMMRRAVTSPFTFLANLVGANEELSRIEFEPGRSALSAGAKERLDSLAQALEERPALSLTVVGRFDPDRDIGGLRRARLEAKVKAQKRETLREEGIEQEAPREVTIAPEEYETYLRLAYLAEPFPKPRDELGQERELPVEEMEKLMFAYLPVSEDDLVALAERRADESKRYLVQEGGVGADRIAITAAQPLADDAKDEDKGARVEFALR